MNLVDAIVEMDRDPNLRIGLKDGNGLTRWLTLDEFKKAYYPFIPLKNVYLLPLNEIERIDNILKNITENTEFKLEEFCYYRDVHSYNIYFVIKTNAPQYPFIGINEIGESSSFSETGDFWCSDIDGCGHCNLIEKLPDQEWPWVESLKASLCKHKCSDNVIDSIEKGTRLFACPNCENKEFILIDNEYECTLLEYENRYSPIIVCNKCNHRGSEKDYISIEKE